jgi:uncharacterized protein (DUF305 family)
LAVQLAVLLAVLLLAATGCSGSGPAAGEGAGARTTAAERPGSGTVLQPGRPGEPAETLAPGTSVQQPRWNDADVAFLQMMVPHHAQALRMCALARTRAQDEQVRDLARRIAGAQGPEVVGMSAWLQARGLEVPSAQDVAQEWAPDGGHGHHHGHGDGGPQMPGLLSDAEMRELAAADGARFDRLFLAGMIGHHRGAVAMSRHALTHGGDLRVNEIAGDVAVEQAAEITRMRSLQRRR